MACQHLPWLWHEVWCAACRSVCLCCQIAMEFGTTSRLAQGTAAAVQFGVDPQDALDKISKLQERLSTLEQV